MDAGFENEAEYLAHRRRINRRAVWFLIAMSPIVLLLVFVFLAATSFLHVPVFF